MSLYSVFEKNSNRVSILKNIVMKKILQILWCFSLYLGFFLGLTLTFDAFIPKSKTSNFIFLIVEFFIGCLLSVIFFYFIKKWRSRYKQNRAFNNES
jgi:hypothetical protein